MVTLRRDKRQSIAMKKTLLTLVVLTVAGVGNITAQQVTNTENEKIEAHVFGNEYSVMVYCKTRVAPLNLNTIPFLSVETER